MLFGLYAAHDMETQQWHWQPYGTVWKGIGTYHITLAVSNRQPLLGTLVIPDNDPTKAKIIRSPLGEDIVRCILSIPQHHAETAIWQYCLMPDHIHLILRVTREMPVGIRSVVRGFWQACKKTGTIHTQDTQFHEKPHIRVLSRRHQLQTMIEYVRLNPQRLATKRIFPDYFRVQHSVEIAGHTYDAVGNVALLLNEQRATVHVHKELVQDAEQHHFTQPLRDYMNGCVIAARQGTLMVSPFVSPKEKSILEVLLKEKHAIIYIVDNGFREYYKPAGNLFEACAEGRLLLLSPTRHDSDKKHISRADCVALNALANEICKSGTMPDDVG